MSLFSVGQSSGADSSPQPTIITRRVPHPRGQRVGLGSLRPGAAPFDVKGAGLDPTPPKSRLSWHDNYFVDTERLGLYFVGERDDWTELFVDKGNVYEKRLQCLGELERRGWIILVNAMPIVL